MPTALPPAVLFSIGTQAIITANSSGNRIQLLLPPSVKPAAMQMHSLLQRTTCVGQHRHNVPVPRNTALTIPVAPAPNIGLSMSRYLVTCVSITIKNVRKISAKIYPPSPSASKPTCKIHLGGASVNIHFTHPIHVYRCPRSSG